MFLHHRLVKKYIIYDINKIILKNVKFYKIKLELIFRLSRLYPMRLFWQRIMKWRDFQKFYFPINKLKFILRFKDVILSIKGAINLLLQWLFCKTELIFLYAFCHTLLCMALKSFTLLFFSCNVTLISKCLKNSFYNFVIP